jgi:hypothetical protein
MHTQLPFDSPLPVRLRAFADFLDGRLATLEALLEETVEKDDRYARLKTERAELSVIRIEFRELFEREL